MIRALAVITFVSKRPILLDQAVKLHLHGTLEGGQHVEKTRGKKEGPWSLYGDRWRYVYRLEFVYHSGNDIAPRVEAIQQLRAIFRKDFAGVPVVFIAEDIKIVPCQSVGDIIADQNQKMRKPRCQKRQTTGKPTSFKSRAKARFSAA